MFAIAFVGVLAATSEPSRCQLHEVNRVAHRWEGSCSRLFGQQIRLALKPASAIASGKWRSDVQPTAVWSGDMTNEGNLNAAIELEIYVSGPGVLRTPFAWYEATDYRATDSELSFAIDTARTAAPSDVDRDIVRRADALLSSTTVWNRADNRQCPSGATTLSIYCAMIRASEDMACGTHHRRPAMEVVRQVIEERSANRNYEHRLMDYNNDSRTTLADVHSAFVEALTRMKGTLDQPPPKPAACPPPGRAEDHARALTAS